MRTESRDLPRASTSGVAMSAAALCGLLLAGSFAPRWIAFAQQQPRPSFEVASIKPNNSPSGNGGLRFDPGALTAENVGLRFLITWGYNVKMFQLTGGPGWMESAKFDIAAKAEGNASSERLRLMLQSLLEERFKLQLRHETKIQSVYSLVPAKSGIKLRESRADCEALAREQQAGQLSRRNCGTWSGSDHEFTGTKISMAQFVEGLSQMLEFPVIDKTGFAGNFDVRLAWSGSDPVAAPDGVAGKTADPAIFTALREQLGLKLESAKGPVEVLVVDHLEHPSGN